MILQTHWLIANKIHEYITPRYGEVLNRRYFAYGSIQPDISRRNHPTKHTIDDSLDFVVNQIEQYEDQPQNIENHSKHIGMINHYLSDFFCSQHYYRLHDGFKGLFPHLNYERKLHKTLKSLNIKGLLDMSVIKNWSYFSGNFHDLVHALEDEYKSLEPSIENDIIFALRAPLIVSCYLLRPSRVAGLIACPA